MSTIQFSGVYQLRNVSIQGPYAGKEAAEMAGKLSTSVNTAVLQYLGESRTQMFKKGENTVVFVRDDANGNDLTKLKAELKLGDLSKVLGANSELGQSFLTGARKRIQALFDKAKPVVDISLYMQPWEKPETAMSGNSEQNAKNLMEELQKIPLPVDNKKMLLVLLPHQTHDGKGRLGYVDSIQLDAGLVPKEELTP